MNAFRSHKTFANRLAQFGWLFLIACCLFAEPTLVRGQQGDVTAEAARELFDAGNWSEALTIYKLCLESSEARPDDLKFAIQSLQRLNRLDEVDAFFKTVLDKNNQSPEMHFAVGKAYRQLPKYGYEIAGEFHRGNQRGGGAVLQIGELDRVRAINQYVKAIKLCDKEDQKLLSRINQELAYALIESRNGRWSWRLQRLTNLESLPDPIPGWNRWGGGASASDPPVDKQGEPILYEIPESWQAAKSDGERWRWALSQWALASEADLQESEITYADFLASLFGISNLDRLGWKPNFDAEAGGNRFDLGSLSDEETIAKLATGLTRFSLPEGHRYLEIYRRHGKWEKLANAYLSRTQRSRAAEALLLGIENEKNEPTKKRLQDRYDQIINPWVKWDATRSSSYEGAGGSSTKLLHVTHRNATKLKFTAKAIDVVQLLADLKEKLEKNAKKVSHYEFQVEQLGWRLLQENQQKYVGDVVESWDLTVELGEDHADQNTSIENPLTKAGAYLVEVSAGEEGASQSRLVVWVTDTVLLQKPTDSGPLYGVLDAKRGLPIANANLELFGYNPGNQFAVSKKQIDIKKFEIKTNEEGLVLVPFDTDTKLRGFSWLATATTDEGRLAHLGFNNLWFSPRNSKRELGKKIFVVTDRPVYRPGDVVEYKAWIAKPSYAVDPNEAVSEFAHKAFQVELIDSRGDKVWTGQLTANANGGITGSYELPTGASLGNYRLQVIGFGGGTFRVEEYRKPEFEVTVEAPDKPILLGKSFEATIRAKYYFGSPVSNAKISYRVMRTTSQSHWHPIGPWDWLYGQGYNWVGVDASWHPGWSRWGCYAPNPPWFPNQSGSPEMVAEGEAEIDANGTYQLKIDTADALARNASLDYRYQVIAEVTDASRRTITGQKSLLAAKSPVRATLWLDKGFYDVGDTLSVSLSVRTPDGKPVEGEGTLRLIKLLPDEETNEEEIQTWELFSDLEGTAELKIKASQPGRYRLVYSSLAVDGIRAEAGSLFTIRGNGYNSDDFQFNALELIPDKVQYQTGDTVRLLINTDQPDSMVALFLRPLNGIYGKPQMVRLTGKSTMVEIPVGTEDQPNFFVEGLTVADGRLHTVVKQIIVPPTSRVIEVEALPSADAYLPGQEAKLKVRLSNEDSTPLVGEATVAIYDKSIDAIAGRDAIGDIRKTFWSWRRSHRPMTSHNLNRIEQPVVPKGILPMQHLGLRSLNLWESNGAQIRNNRRGYSGSVDRMFAGATMSPQPTMMAVASQASDAEGLKSSSGVTSDEPAVTVRKNFADTALWVGSLETDLNGIAEIPFTLPESLTAWRIRVWGMASGTRVGEGETEVVTRKDLMVRLQAPRFLVESDEVTLSAIVNNYYPVSKKVTVRLEADGESLGLPSDTTRTVMIEAGGESRIDWLATAKSEGKIKLRAIAIAQAEVADSSSMAESDAMQIELPILVHGAERVESFSEVLSAEDSLATFEIVVPEKRRPEATRLEFHYRASLVGAMLDTLPYLIEYPHGCTEQTLNRFLPAAITQKVLLEMGATLDALQPKDEATPLGPKDMNSPVYSSEEVDQVIKLGVTRLGEMQLSDGGWGWFSGFGESSSAHTTAVVVRGLLVARENGVEVPEEMLSRGIAWLVAYRDRQLELLANCDGDGKPIDADKKYKRQVDNLDALTYLTLARAKQFKSKMRDRLVDERLKLPCYSLGLIGLALHIESESIQEETPEKKAILGDRDKLIRNLRQYVVTDKENQTAYLELGGGSWWYWYGSEYETHACFLQLLAATEPKSDLAAAIVKYLLNNRRDAARWDSTRDTALVVEAIAAYHRANKQEGPQTEPIKVEVWLDGKQRDAIEIRPEQALLYDGTFQLEGNELSAGRHTLELRKSGDERLFIAGTLTNFSLESDLRSAGLEVKIARRMTKLTPISVEGEGVDGRGSAISTTERKYRRTNLPNLGEIQSGDLVEIELTLTSKNDYEYFLIEDPKPAGFEPVEVRSGYNGNNLGAYVEFRDQQVLFYARRLARGEHTLKYRLRAETPGKFAALPAQVSAMYAPDLRGNSDEQRVVVTDQE